jgi:type II secretory pathway component PulK
MNTSGRTVNGFALPLVLIILALLTALSFGLARLVSANMQLLQERKTEWTEELQLRDALEKAVHMLLVGKYDPKSVSLDSASLPLNSAPVMINGLTVRVQSWSGLYSLSFLGYQNSNAVFRQMMDSKTAQRLSAELGDWIDEDTRGRFRGGEGADYATRKMLQRPRNAPLRSIDELLELPSVTPDMMNGRGNTPGFRDLFLAGGEDNFDLGTAPDILVGPLLGLSGATAREVIEARKEADWSKVRFLIDENHWVFNDHPAFYKGPNYRLEFESKRGVTSRVQMKLTPYDPQGLYAIIDWQVPDYPYE